MISPIGFNFTSNSMGGSGTQLANWGSAQVAHSGYGADAISQVMTGASDPFHQNLLGFAQSSFSTGLALTNMPYHIQLARAELDLLRMLNDLSKPARPN